MLGLWQPSCDHEGRWHGMQGIRVATSACHFSDITDPLDESRTLTLGFLVWSKLMSQATLFISVLLVIAVLSYDFPQASGRWNRLRGWSPRLVASDLNKSLLFPQKLSHTHTPLHTLEGWGRGWEASCEVR